MNEQTNERTNEHTNGRTESMCVSDCNVEGIHIKKNMSIRIMTCTLYMDSDYFPGPEIFDPER